MQRLVLLMTLIFSASANAQFRDYFEIGLSGNYRKVYLSEDSSGERAYDENSAYIASVAYYFREMTAIELSYSQGKNKRYIPSNAITSTTTHRYDLMGADLVFTFGKRGEQFIPYIKGGVTYFDRKSIEYLYINNADGSILPSEPVEIKSTLVPSVGAGLQIRITQQLSFKAGIDVWTSGAINKDVEEFDWAARLGVSWFL